MCYKLGVNLLKKGCSLISEAHNCPPFSSLKVLQGVIDIICYDNYPHISSSTPSGGALYLTCTSIRECTEGVLI